MFASRRALVLPLVVGVGSLLGAGQTAPVDEARAAYEAQLEQLGHALSALDSVAGSNDSARVRAAFRRAREAYKRSEWWLVVTDTSAVSAINGPEVERGGEIDDAADSAEAIAAGVALPPPVGLQAVEAMLYPVVVPGGTHIIRVAIEPAVRAVARARQTSARDSGWNDIAVFDAARRELARVDAVGLASTDSPLARAGLSESAAALDGLAAALASYGVSLENRMRAAADVLRGAHSDDAFDRLQYVTAVALPLEHALDDARRALNIASASGRGLWRSSSPSIWDTAAFDPGATVPAEDVALGRALFQDTRLGGASGRSCATCHVPQRAFTDGLVHAAPLRHRKTPTVLNAALEVGLFADLRAPSLEAQVRDVVENPSEMAGEPLEVVAARLGTQADRVARALAAYERTLVRLDSPFDRAVHGDAAALSASARRGFTVFMGKGRCATCHVPPLFNGVTAPDFSAPQIEVLGVPAEPVMARAPLDRDPGRFAVTRAAADLFAFRVPTVRNVAATGPYMHNGVYRTLDEVIDFYARGGGDGIGARTSDQTLSTRRLALRPQDRRDLVAFLRSLTDTSTRP